MKMCASSRARAAYAASAPPAFPALGMASFVAPRYFAIETATLIPRALKLCVGFSDSSLDQRRIAEPNTELQGARDECGRFDGKISRRDEARHPQRRERRRRAGRVCRARSARSAHLHAA